MSKIPSYILCKNPEEARQVLEKIERESDLRWIGSSVKPTRNLRNINENAYPIIIYANEVLNWSTKNNFNGLTNFTKAEDFLLSDETKIRLEELDNKLDKLINSMTNKTWDNLTYGDIIFHPNGQERKVLNVLDHLVAITPDLESESTVYWLSKKLMIEQGYKIKGASEDKGSIDDVITKLEKLLSGRIDFGLNPFDKTISEAIEMLKKLK